MSDRPERERLQQVSETVGTAFAQGTFNHVPHFTPSQEAMIAEARNRADAVYWDEDADTAPSPV